MRVYVLVARGHGEPCIAKATDAQEIAYVWRFFGREVREASIPWWYWFTPRKRWLAKVSEAVGLPIEEEG